MLKDVKIIIADDHAVVRKGLIQILNDISWITKIDEASNGNELLEKISNNGYNLVILDISMPGKSGLDVLKEIKTASSSVKILVLSMHPEEQYALRVIKAGASGYLTKESAPEELVSAIESILTGGKYITASVAEQLAESFKFDKELYPHQKLSDREFQVFKLIVEGNSLKQIAEKLNLSEKTISTYKKRISDKMGMSRTELVHYALKHNLFD